MSAHKFVGFGFGPIQSGLFVREARRSGRFDRIVVAEIDKVLVEAVRKNNGTYYINIAADSGVEVEKIEGIEILNPLDETDRPKLIAALGEATEIVTSLPSVKFYDAGGSASIAATLAEVFAAESKTQTIVYTAENNNHAAEILEQSVTAKHTPSPGRVQFLNTVIGKMSQVVTDPAKIREINITPMTPDLDRAFLIEEFNRILVTRTTLENFRPGIEVFIEKDDLLPFEEAKLYGHNAIHALLSYLAAVRGYMFMNELRDDAALMAVARGAFLDESGAALCLKYADLRDPLFTPAGYRVFAEDLLTRMTNPWLNDTVERAGRDPLRKLGPGDRIFGTMELALTQGIQPRNMALGALAGLDLLLRGADEYGLPDECRAPGWRDLNDALITRILHWLWQDHLPKHADAITSLVINAKPQLEHIINA